MPHNPNTTDEDTKANSEEDSPGLKKADKNDTDQNLTKEEEKKETEQEYDKIVKLTQCKTGKVSKDDFTLIQVIGTGSYGKVLLVKKKSSGNCYAMKILKKKQLRKQK